MSAPAHDVAHYLATIAREPRPAGGHAERTAREYAAEVLREGGFAVHDELFEYSAFPGRYGTPLGGALGASTVIATACFALREPSRSIAPLVLAVGLAVTVLFTRAMLNDAVLDVGFARARSHNLVATRGPAVPRVWLVAHLDSKSQPVPSAARAMGISLLGIGIAIALLAATLQLAGVTSRTAWWAAVVFAVAGAPAVIGSFVGTRSAGALDNASGVAAVLAAAMLIRSETPVGVLLPSAEELGLAGARAWAREWAVAHQPGIALNCDGVDDTGELTLMYSGMRSPAIADALREVTPALLAVRRMPPGLITDSVALADRGWQAVTVSRGGLASLRRVHSTRDTLDNLSGCGIADAATLLARAVEALA